MMYFEKKPRQYVYFITYENGPIKIGKAANVKKRLSGIQTSIPQKIEILGVMFGPWYLEGAVHSRFKHLHVSGEWFRRAPELNEFIETHTMSLEDYIAKSERYRNEPEVRHLKQKLSKKYNEVEEELAEKIMRSVHRELRNTVTNCMYLWLDAARTINQIDTEFQRCFANNRLVLLGADKLRLEARRIVDSALGVDWQAARNILYSDNFDQDAVDKHAERWINRMARESTNIRAIAEYTWKQN